MNNFFFFFLIFLFFDLLLIAQTKNPFFYLFKNQFYAYPFSGWGCRKAFDNNLPLEKIYFHTQTPFFLQLNENAHWNFVVSFIHSLKMYNSPNFPIKTPDYKILANFSYHLNDNFQAIFSIQHHSNGQKDSLYFQNGDLNLDNGNFSVNSFQIYALKTFSNFPLKWIALQTEHLFFYFSMAYMKKFYFHHAFYLQTLFTNSFNDSFTIYHHFNWGCFLHLNHRTRFKSEYIAQLKFKNWNFMPFFRAYYGPDEYNSRYIFQNFQITVGISSIIKPLLINGKY